MGAAGIPLGKSGMIPKEPSAACTPAPAQAPMGQMREERVEDTETWACQTLKLEPCGTVSGASRKVSFTFWQWLLHWKNQIQLQESAMMNVLFKISAISIAIKEKYMKSEKSNNDQEAFPNHKDCSYPRNTFILLL